MKDKIQSFLLTPIKVSYKKGSDYTSIEKIVLNPMFLVMLVFFTIFQAYSLSGETKLSQSADAELGNAMIYFERGDFDNALLMLDSIVSNYPKTTASYQAMFYIGRTAFIQGDNEIALDNLKKSVSKLKIDILKKEAFIILGSIESNYKRFDNALKYTISVNEKNYINILKAKVKAENGDVNEAIQILDSLNTENSIYNEFYEEVYGFVLSIN